MKATQLCRKHNGENSVTSLSHRAKLLTVEFLQQNVPDFIEHSVWPPKLSVDYAASGALQQDVYRVPIVGLEDLKDRVRTCWASLDQQLINKGN